MHDCEKEHEHTIKRYWLDYLDKDEIDRRKHLEKIAEVLIRDSDALKDHKELRLHSMASLLDSYIQDCLMYLG